MNLFEWSTKGKLVCLICNENTFIGGTFLEANIGESFITPGPSNNDHKARPFDQLWEDAQREFYLGCKKFSKLSFSMKLLHIKTLCN